MKRDDVKYFIEARQIYPVKCETYFTGTKQTKQTRRTRLTRNVWNSWFCGEFMPCLVFRMNAIQKHGGPDG